MKATKRKGTKSHEAHLPGNVCVGGKTFNIVLVSASSDSLEGDSGVVVGRCRPDLQEIQIRKGQTPENTQDTLLHELIHAIDYHAQLKLKERQVHVLASELLNTFWESPLVVGYLLTRFKDEKADDGTHG